MKEQPRPTAASAFDRLLEIVRVLRSEQGCPWDRRQTHESLKTDTLEEVYEFLEAVEVKDAKGMAEELGDLLILTALHAQIAGEDGTFDMRDVLNVANAKLVRRHPHVFGSVEVADTDEVIANWEAIKRDEPGYESRTSVLDGVPTALPALMAAAKLQRKAARVGFDWNEVRDVLGKVREELAEAEALLNAPDGERDALEDEIGDLLFGVVNLARFMSIDPEAALRRANRKFTRRFRRIEALLEEQGREFETENLETLDRLWEQAKAEETDDE